LAARHIWQVTVGDMSRMEPVDRIQAIQKERWELLCGVCRQRCGAKVRLHAPMQRTVSMMLLWLGIP
jgi:hypothetical protein